MRVAKSLNKSIADNKIYGRIYRSNEKLRMSGLGHLSCQRDFHEFLWLMFLATEVQEAGVWRGFKDLQAAHLNKLWRNPIDVRARILIYRYVLSNPSVGVHNLGPANLAVVNTAALTLASLAALHAANVSRTLCGAMIGISCGFLSSCRGRFLPPYVAGLYGRSKIHESRC